MPCIVRISSTISILYTVYFNICDITRYSSLLGRQRVKFPLTKLTFSTALNNSKALFIPLYFY